MKKALVFLLLLLLAFGFCSSQYLKAGTPLVFKKDDIYQVWVKKVQNSIFEEKYITKKKISLK